MSETEPSPEIPAQPPERSSGPAGGQGRPGRFSTTILVGVLAGGILLVAFTAAVLRSGGKSLLPRIISGSPAPSRGVGEPGTPSIISPIGSVPHGALTLHWTKVDGIDEYQAFIYDNRIQVIWRSPRTQGDSVEVPESARSLILAGPAYFWRVAGLRKDGTEESSPTVQFTVTP